MSEFIRIALGAAVGCGLYDTVMFTIMRIRARRYQAKSMAAAEALMTRYTQLKAEAEAKKS